MPSLIDQISYPHDLKGLNVSELKKIAIELREEVIKAVSQNGGHLGAGLGVIELTVALHHVFNAPEDQIVWDIGHQAYPHKYLTGRKETLHTIRQPGGLSPFLKRSESEYDVIGAGHSSTAISSALGIAVARDIQGDDYHVVSIIGDGALSAGMAYEAMNNAGDMKTKMIVILNDNKMTIAPAVGAMSKYLSRLMSTKTYLKSRSMVKNLLTKLPKPIENAVKKAKKYTKDFVTGGNFFEEIGFHYVGPIDGHDMDQLIPVLKALRDTKEIESPILVHVITEKGKGFHSPNSCIENFHAVSKFDLDSKIQLKGNAKPTFTKVLASSLVRLMEKDEAVYSITAAMPSGTGLNEVAKKFEDRVFDVGIAEQHAVTFAAGPAIKGIKPFVAIYSTFLQRGYDQVVHDVAIQCLPVRFAVDRAGYVGADGATHVGAFDITFLASLPNFIVMAPSDENELAIAINTSYTIEDRPSAFRFPRGEIYGNTIPESNEKWEIGEGKIIQKGSSGIAVLSLGTRLNEVIKADQELQRKGITLTIADMRFVKPLDEALIKEIASTHHTIITIEEGSIGGFAAHVTHFLTSNELLDKGLRLRSLFMPDYFLEHSTIDNQYKEAGLSSSSVIELVLGLLEERSNAA